MMMTDTPGRSRGFLATNLHLMLLAVERFEWACHLEQEQPSYNECAAWTRQNSLLVLAVMSAELSNTCPSIDVYSR
jgi:hypothetical protein